MKIALWPSLYLPNIGGLEILVHELALGLQRKGHEVFVITNSKEKYTEYEVESIPVFGFPFLFALSSFRLSLIKEILLDVEMLLKKRSPEVIHIHGWLENFSFFQTKVLVKTSPRIYLTIHGLLEQKEYFASSCSGRLFEMSSGVNTVSKALLDQLPSKKVQCIHNGLTSLKDPKPISTPFQLLMAGRLTWEKNFEIGFLAFDKIQKKYPEARLTLIGDGPEKSSLIALRKTLHLEDKIEILGFVEPHQVGDWMDRASLILVPSEYESFGLTALLASFRQRPVIASRILGLKEVIEDRVTGILVEPKNPDSFAQAIDDFFSSPSKQEEMGKAGYQRANRFFSASEMVDKYLHMYREDPLVSVIIPAHHGEKWIREALESVMLQDYKRLEILVIDSSTTEETKRIAESFPLVHYERVSYANTASSRARGAVLAKGEFLAFLDQDDLWDSQKISKQVLFLQTFSEYGAVIGRQKMFLHPGSQKPHWLKQEFLKEPQEGFLPSALVVRKKVFEEMGGFNEELSFASDVDWFLRAHHQGILIKKLEEVLLYRRIHEENSSYNYETLQKQILMALKLSLQARR